MKTYDSYGISIKSDMKISAKAALDLVEEIHFTLDFIYNKSNWSDSMFIPIKHKDSESRGMLIGNETTGQVYPVVFSVTTETLYDLPISQWKVEHYYLSIRELVNSGWRIDR